MDRLEQDLRRSLEQILLRQHSGDPKTNIIGFGLGKKIRQGRETDEDAVRIFVRKKLSPWTESPDSEIMPLNPWLPIEGKISKHKVFNFEHVEQFRPEDIHRLPPPGMIWTDIVEVSAPAQFFTAYRGNYRGTIIGGISIGLGNYETGTVGCFVRNSSTSTARATREFYLLTAGHVLDLFDNNPPTDLVCQPGGEDQTPNVNMTSYGVAVRVDTTNVRLHATNPQVYTVDAGIARPVSMPLATSSHQTPQYNAEKIQLQIIECGGVSGTASPRIGMLVKKVGRTTGLTYGRITDVSLSYDVEHAGEKATMSDQFATTMMSKRGDSGALLMDDHNRAVGLLIGGDDERSIFTPIDEVLRTLQVEMF
ncbi:hypothetical protein AB1K70_26705 [Bremerella sp. JC770]|uniref:hypothetical protein n=1 Tax=Bremerella sp. JC770 TaxID=3232137 RepID=UPI0034573DBC